MPVVWLTGLPGAGKTTIAEALAARLRQGWDRVEVLDGDAVRPHLGHNLGFTREDRNTNVARIAYVAHLLSRNGITVIVAAVSPFREARDRARALIGAFIEVHVATPLEECMRRDPKGLYRRAVAGQIQSFTGVSQEYEAPLSPELRLDTTEIDVASAVDSIRALLD